MNTRRKKSVAAALAIVTIYVTTPFVAGVIGTSDRRGPKIFAESHHEILYRMGYSLLHDDKPRVHYWHERPWFYGIRGKRTPDQSGEILE